MTAVKAAGYRKRMHTARSGKLTMQFFQVETPTLRHVPGPLQSKRKKMKCKQDRLPERAIYPAC